MRASNVLNTVSPVRFSGVLTSSSSASPRRPATRGGSSSAHA
jgi:hypothetical protein